MHPFLAVVRTIAPNPAAAGRLLASGRKLTDVLRKATPPGVKVTTQTHRGGLVLIASASTTITADQRATATAALQAECDKMWAPGVMRVDAYTKDTLPTSFA